MEFREKIEVRIVDGVHFLFYKGEKLPFLVKTTVIQDSDVNVKSNSCYVIAEFEAVLK